MWFKVLRISDSPLLKHMSNEHTEGGTSIPLQTTNYFYLACKQVSNNVKTVRRPLLTRWQQQQQRQKRAQWHIIFIPFQQLLFSLVKIRDDVKV